MNNPCANSPINAYTSCRERRNSTLSRKCAPRTRSSAAAARGPGPAAEAAFSASARALRAPIGFHGCVRGAPGGCPRSVRRGGGRLPVGEISILLRFVLVGYFGEQNLRSGGTR